MGGRSGGEEVRSESVARLGGREVRVFRIGVRRREGEVGEGGVVSVLGDGGRG
jgi:hypothetical protein